jgi:hypothetical protein
LRLGGYCLLRGDGSRCSALLRSCGHHFFNGGGCGFRAPPEEQGAGAPAAPITLQQWGLGYDS